MAQLTRVQEELFADIVAMSSENMLQQIRIGPITPQNMTEDELVELVYLVRTIKWRHRTPPCKISVADDGRVLRVEFDYHPATIEMMRGLQRKRWSPENGCWEVHISEYPALRQIFKAWTEPAATRAYASYVARYREPELSITATEATLEGMRLPLDEIEEVTSFEQEYWEDRKRKVYQRRLFDRVTGKMPIGLLPRVLRALQATRTQVKVADERMDGTQSLQDVALTATMRNYQSYAIDKALEAKSGMIKVATGGGKTVIMAGIIDRLRRPTLCLVHRKTLLTQTIKSFERDLGIEVGQIGDGVIDVRPVTVATVQTVVRALGEEVELVDEDDGLDYSDDTDVTGKEEMIRTALRDAELLLVDESHRLAAETYFKVAMNCQARYRFGLSATPKRADGKDLMIEAALGGRLVNISASYLIQRGWLVKPDIYMVDLGNEMDVGNALSNLSYPAVYSQRIIQNERRNAFIAGKAQEIAADGRTVLILIQKLRHGEILQEMLPEAVFLRGKDDSGTREDVLGRFIAKDLKILIASTILDEGVDIPTLGAMINGGGGKSETTALQRVGRTLRLAPGKSGAEIYDFIDRAKYLFDHSMARKAIYESEKEFVVHTVPFAA